MRLVARGEAFGHVDRSTACTGLLAALSVPARADTCDSATADMTACYAAALAGTNKKLNAVYREIESRLGDDPDHAEAARRCRARLDRVPRRRMRVLGLRGRGWLGLSDDGLDVPRRPDDGAHGAARGLLDCEEGDLSCPVPGN